MDFESEAVTLDCNGSRLVGIFELPERSSDIAVIIVVGGPQYRIGSHRQFVLLARRLAREGIPSLRFDHRGFGDSEGSSTFEETGPDIRSAIDAVQEQLPGVRRVIIWGLCDAASAAMMYADTDDRVAGLVVLNPWVRSDESLARSMLGSYYRSRLFQRDFWRKVFRGGVDYSRAIRGLIRNIGTALRSAEPNVTPDDSEIEKMPFQVRMLDGVKRFNGKVLLILSGEDITAREFEHLLKTNRQWRRCFNKNNVSIEKIAEDNHTFSRREWSEQVERWTLEWIGTL